MNGELGIKWTEVVVAYFKVISYKFLVGLNQKNSPCVGSRIEVSRIRTENLTLVQILVHEDGTD